MKDWYHHVQEETMAPARMMQFADKHIADCEECQQDMGLTSEMEKIRKALLPEAKIPKSKRDVQSATPEISPDEDDGQKKEKSESDDKGDKDDKENKGSKGNNDSKEPDAPTDN